jgi:hypothetical protein
MSYIINLTNGTKLTELKDGVFDQKVTDITLVGRNTTNYGAFVNDNLVHILENFANLTQPNNPLVGQLWYDTATNVMRVYNGRSFIPTGNTIVANTQPVDLTSGGLWIDSSKGQLYFNDGANTVLAGPGYSSVQGKTGAITHDVIDRNGVQHTVSLLYVGGTLLGIFSKDSFTPREPIDPNFVGDVKIGFTAGIVEGASFNVEVSSAKALTAADGTLQPAESFVSSVNESPVIQGSVSIQNEIPLQLGKYSQFEVSVINGLTQFSSTTVNQNFKIGVATSGSGSAPALYVDSVALRTGIFTETPAATLDVNGTFRISSSAPATHTSPGVTGQIAWDSGYVYVCVATNSWKRTALSTW